MQTTEWQRPTPRTPRPYTPPPADPSRGPIAPGSEADVCHFCEPAWLVQVTGAHPATVRRWKRGFPMEEPSRRLVLLMKTGNLGMLSSPWKGWRMSQDGTLVSPEGWAFTPGDVRTIPLLRDALSRQRKEELESRLKAVAQHDWVEGRYVEPDEMRAHEAVRV